MLLFYLKWDRGLKQERERERERNEGVAGYDRKQEGITSIHEHGKTMSVITSQSLSSF